MFILAERADALEMITPVLRWKLIYSSDSLYADALLR